MAVKRGLPRGPDANVISKREIDKYYTMNTTHDTQLYGFTAFVRHNYGLKGLPNWSTDGPQCTAVDGVCSVRALFRGAEFLSQLNVVQFHSSTSVGRQLRRHARLRPPRRS